jgi:hypothetical protein
VGWLRLLGWSGEASRLVRECCCAARAALRLGGLARQASWSERAGFGRRAEELFSFSNYTLKLFHFVFSPLQISFAKINNYLLSNP